VTVYLDKPDHLGLWDPLDRLENVVLLAIEALKVEEECLEHQAHLELLERAVNLEVPVCLENLANLEDRVGNTLKKT